MHFRLWSTCLSTSCILLENGCINQTGCEKVSTFRTGNYAPARLPVLCPFTPLARQDKTVLSVSCLVCWCELDDCFERAQTSNFRSATVLSCRESNSHRRSGRDTDKTVLSYLGWRCELAFMKPSACLTKPETAFNATDLAGRWQASYQHTTSEYDHE